jgi:hypothetical protein
MAAGTMVELTAADGDINCADQLDMFEAYQKVFVVNGANLKVADFINVKLTHGALATAHAKGDTLTQAVSGAVMVVDFTNSAKTMTYGYVTNGTFDTSNSVSGSGSGSAFTPTAVTDKPHWYDWTVYPGGASGSMPNYAYIGCLYRGRLVLAGDPAHPHLWYMSKVNDPWNWVYSDVDPLTAVAGGNADAGEVGDIIRCLIPYKDDYLLFGCANSLWVLTGDPAQSGTIDEVDLTVGVYGAKSWCFDGDGNIYFFGTNGIYQITPDLKSVRCISELYLPNLVDDVDANPETHRIVLEHDRKRNGIIITITKLTDGSNQCYYYNLAAQGFFPETYPVQCGPFSLCYYAANDNDYADLLVGCFDGFIRKWDEASKDDNIGVSNTAISSYVVLPIAALSEDMDMKGKLTSLTVELAGGASGGDFSDTDGVTVELFTGDDAGTCLEDIKDGATAFLSKTYSGTGRKRTRDRCSAAFLGIKLSNSTASETWAVNRIYGNVEKSGTI